MIGGLALQAWAVALTLAWLAVLLELGSRLVS